MKKLKTVRRLLLPAIATLILLVAARSGHGQVGSGTFGKPLGSPVSPVRKLLVPPPP